MHNLLLFLLTSLSMYCSAVRWCVVDNGLNQQLCIEMQQDLYRKNTTLDFRCVYGLHKVDCMHQVRNGAADATNLNAEEIYAAGYHLDLKVAMSEKIDNKEFIDQSFVVIRRSTVKSAKLSSLAGKKLCLPAVDEQNISYHTLISVLIPLGLVKSKSINCQSPARTIANFFGPSCMPGRWAKPGPVNKGEQCSLCHGDCSIRDRYASNTGALRCLVEKNADVAVTNGKAIGAYDKSSKALSPLKFKLLCLQGSLADLDEPCLWLARRTNAVVMSPLAKKQRFEKVRNSIKKIFRAFNKTKPAWFRKILLSSANVTDYIDAHSGGFSYKRYLGNLFVRSMQSPFSIKDCDLIQIRFCLTDSIKVRKCKDIAMAWSIIRIKPELQCQHMDSHLQCINSIQHLKSDLILLSPIDAVHAYVNHGLVPLAIEVDDNDSPQSYLVAVVKKGRKLIPGRLYGVRACFSNDRLRDIVLILLQRLNILRMDSCQFENLGADFFSPACRKRNPDVIGGNSLCAICNNVETGKRTWQYVIKNLSLPKLVDADVAFLELTRDNLAELNFANNIFMLMCSNGSRMAVSQFADCNWMSTSGAVVMGQKKHLSTVSQTKLTELLVYAQQYYEKKRPRDKFTIFSHPLEGYNLFDKRTTKLKPIWMINDNDDSSLANAIGTDSFQIYKRLAQCKSGGDRITICLFLRLMLLILGTRWLT